LPVLEEQNPERRLDTHSISEPARQGIQINPIMRLVLSLFFAGCLAQAKPSNWNGFLEPNGNRDAFLIYSGEYDFQRLDFIRVKELVREKGDSFWTGRTGGIKPSLNPVYQISYGGGGAITYRNPIAKGEYDDGKPLAWARHKATSMKPSPPLLSNSSLLASKSEQDGSSHNRKTRWVDAANAKNKSTSFAIHENEMPYAFFVDTNSNLFEPDASKISAAKKLDDRSTFEEDSLPEPQSKTSPDKNQTAVRPEPTKKDPGKDSNQSPVTEGWDLFVLRELTLKHSPDVLLKKAELRISEKGIPVIKFGRMPTVKAKVSFDDYEKVSQFETYSEPEPYNTFSYGLESRWVLYDGHKNRKEVNIARNEVNQAQWTLYVEEQKVLKNLTNLFFNAVSTQTQMQFLPRIEAISNEKLSVYEKKLKTGIVDRILFSDSLRDLENIRAQILNSAHSLEVTKAEIGFLLHADSAFWGKFKEFVVPEDFESKNDFNAENSYSANLGQAGIDIAKSKYDEIKTGYSPVLEFIGSTGHRSKNRIGFEKHGQELTLGLSLTLPITDRYLTRRKLEQAREEIRKSELEKVRLVTRQRNEFSSEKLKLSQAERSLDFQKEMLDLQKKRLADVMSASALGIYDKSDVLLEEEKLLKREMYVELTRLNYVKQKYQLDLIE
jgi:outer membrane protein TolC